MSLVRFRANNHPQQSRINGAKDEIDDRGTTDEFFDPLNRQYRFTIDVAAAPHNAKCERYYDRHADGLKQPWAGESVWCNPPYSGLESWLEKAWAEWIIAVPRPKVIVMLLPANRTEQSWWQRWVEPFRDQPGSSLKVQFLRGRLRFIKPGATEVRPNERPPFGCCLLVWQ